MSVFGILKAHATERSTMMLERKSSPGLLAAKIVAPLAAPDPKWQALLSNSKISPSLSAGLATTIRKSPEVVQAEEMFQAVNLPKDAPADQKMAMLAVGGAYAPPQSMAERIRGAPPTPAASAGVALTSSSRSAGSSSHSSPQPTAPCSRISSAPRC